MLLSANIIGIHDTFGIKGMFDALAQAGFEGIDFNNDVAEYCTAEHEEGLYRDLGKYAASRGVAICQAHAPFPSNYKDDEERTVEKFGAIVQSMKNAAYLGAPMIVVHPCTHLDFLIEGNPEILFEYNLGFYRRLIPYARKFGIKIAIKNIGRVSITSTPESLNRLYDMLNDSMFTVCFDIGHCLFQGVDPAEAIRSIVKRLVGGCTRVHDNFGEKDSSTLPFYGKVKWEEVMKAFADIDYKGDLNYEASAFIKDIPTDLYLDGLT